MLSNIRVNRALFYAGGIVVHLVESEHADPMDPEKMGEIARLAQGHITRPLEFAVPPGTIRKWLYEQERQRAIEALEREMRDEA
jgi:hypothetical protein